MHSMQFTLENLTRPAPFVSLDEAITQCNTMAGDEDAFLVRLIRSAQSKVELAAAILLGERSVRVSMQYPDLSGQSLEFPQRCWPVASITSITTRDDDGEQVALTGYQSSLASRPAKFGLLPNESWPVVSLEYFDAMSIACVAGLTPTSLLPHCDTAKQAVLLLVGHWFLNREAEVTGTISSTVGVAYDSLISLMQQYRYK